MLKYNKITFNELLKEDLEFLNKVRNLSRHMLHDNKYYTLEDTTKWFDENNPEFYIIYLDEIKIGYFRTSNLIKNESIYIGADLHPDYKGKGLAYESYLKFIPFISKKHNLKKLKLEVLSTNKIALNLYKKLNFEIVNEIEFLRDENKIFNVIMEKKIINIWVKIKYLYFLIII